jgi:assimilatory nitrate reductase catalytic subunit
MYDSTETALEADLLLPAAGWGEKDGTFINSERRFGVARKVRKAPGEALSDFRIFQLIAHAWGCADLFRDWTSPEAVFQILKEVSIGQPCDISGIGDYETIDASGGIQWPCPKGAPVATERRLFEDGRFYHSDGRARFIFSETRPPPDQSEYPFILLTGRGSSAQWHTLTRTGKSAVLRQLAPTEAYVEINPADAAKFGIIMGAKVRITSAQGSVVMQAFITNTVSSGQVFIPMHSPLTNQLTFEAVDPYSRQPSYKFTRVTLKAVAE